MSEDTTQLVVAAFNKEGGAEEALSKLKDAKKGKLVDIQAAVAIRKDTDGGIHYKDVGLTPAKGAAGGVILGSVLAVLTGGTVLALGAIGALVGGIVGKKKRESHLSADRINQIVASLDPGSSAIIAVLDQESAQEMEAEFEELGADIMTATITSDITAQLDAYHEEAYTHSRCPFTITGAPVSTSRLPGNDARCSAR
jgi:uncharacterized membrane protein